jgi:DNA segregation ATPase FtsK/SpoIIIE-like protein
MAERSERCAVGYGKKWSRRPSFTVGLETGNPMDTQHFNSPHSDISEELIEQASALVDWHKKLSISLLQRHLRLGYSQAAALLEIIARAPSRAEYGRSSD